MPGKTWDRYDIMRAVRAKGSNMLKLALMYGLEPSSTRVALDRRNRPGEEAISHFLGVPKSELWPDRYRSAQEVPSTAVSRRTSRIRDAVSTGA